MCLEIDPEGLEIAIESEYERLKDPDEPSESEKAIALLEPADEEEEGDEDGEGD